MVLNSGLFQADWNWKWLLGCMSALIQKFLAPNIYLKLDLPSAID